MSFKGLLQGNENKDSKDYCTSNCLHITITTIVMLFIVSFPGDIHYIFFLKALHTVYFFSN